MTNSDVALPSPAINELVDYHSPYRTGIFDGKIIGINPDGTVRLQVFLPGAAVGRTLYEEPAVTLRSVSYGPEGRARPRNA